MRTSYGEKLKDPRWQKLRLEILQRDNWTCQQCAATEKTLHVHHIAYQEGEPWETATNLLLTLCHECHEAEGPDHKEAVAFMLSVLAGCGVRTAFDLWMFVSAIDDEWCKNADGSAVKAWQEGTRKYFAGWPYKKDA